MTPALQHLSCSQVAPRHDRGIGRYHTSTWGAIPPASRCCRENCNDFKPMQYLQYLQYLSLRARKRHRTARAPIRAQLQEVWKRHCRYCRCCSDLTRLTEPLCRPRNPLAYMHAGVDPAPPVRQYAFRRRLRPPPSCPPSRHREPTMQSSLEVARSCPRPCMVSSPHSIACSSILAT